MSLRACLVTGWPGLRQLGDGLRYTVVCCYSIHSTFWPRKFSTVKSGAAKPTNNSPCYFINS